MRKSRHFVKPVAVIWRHMCWAVVVDEQIVALAYTHCRLSGRYGCKPVACNGGLLRDSGYLREERLGIGRLCVVNVAREYAFNHATELRWNVATVDALTHHRWVMPQYVDR